MAYRGQMVDPVAQEFAALKQKAQTLEVIVASYQTFDVLSMLAAGVSLVALGLTVIFLAWDSATVDTPSIVLNCI